MAETYKHSGTITVTGTLLGLVGGGLTAVALAFAYTYAIVWIPFVYVNALLTFLFGVAIGFAVAAGAKAGKLRNMAVVGLLGVFCGLLGLWIAWAVDPMARLGRASDGPSLSPFFAFGALFQYMGALYENGSWGFGSATVSGIFLGIIWAIEAGLIVLAAAFTAPGRLMDVAFCEPCESWTKLQTGLRTISLEGVDAVLARMAEGDVAALRETKPADAADAGHVRVDLATCPSCANSAYLTLTLVQKKVDEKGKESKEEKAVLQNLVLSAGDVGILKEPAKRA